MHPHSHPDIQPSLEPAGGGWHCSHLYYEFDRAAVADCPPSELGEAMEAFAAAVDPADASAPTRLQASIVSGQKADFGIMAMDPNPLRVDGVHQRLQSGLLGGLLRPTYSFVSVTEISEYVPSVEDFAAQLAAQGEEVGSDTHQAKVANYAARLTSMNKQRLTPEFPEWSATCFYPMNKKRKVGENWFLLTKEERKRLMSEHARSGMQFAGRVSQLITVALGFDDWEWGVTLWAANPEFLKDIVYQMRFDEASARYAEFGPFYVSYVATAAQILEHCQVRN